MRTGAVAFVLSAASCFVRKAPFDCSRAGPTCRQLRSARGVPGWQYQLTPTGTSRTFHSIAPTCRMGLADGYDATQVALLEEECILVSENDDVIGHESKKNCHLNTEISARNLLHRAFSVFLFNNEGKLLLQQRAAEKITFPLCWTNTCCSHPLYCPAELDASDNIGVKRAAQRKLEHELGIAPAQVPLDAFQFLTRIHYKAETDATWGEHEIDYILFLQREVDVNLNPNEVKDVKYVSEAELRALMADADARSVTISPWFRLIVESGLLHEWWATLPTVASKATPHLIHRF